jgi:predicted nuclease of predicted toxin-antitoxin system
MIYLADENVQRTVVESLRQKGYDVRHIQELMPGAPDTTVLDMAARESAILLTYDRDFGEIVFRQKRVATGVILIRLAGVPPEHIAELVAATLIAHEEEIVGAFTVIAPQGVRIRRLPLDADLEQA